MHPEITTITRLLDSLPEVELAYVFGSMGRGQATSESDVDIAVQAKTPLDQTIRISLIEELAGITGRAIDLIDLRTAGEPLLGEILRDGIRIKGSDTLHANLVTRHVFDCEDFLPYVQRMLKERRQRWIE